MAKQELFEVGDEVRWKGKYEPGSFMKQYGRGPFVVQHIAEAQGACPHSRPHPSGRCNRPNKPEHPQAVTLKNKSGKQLGQLSGSFLTKV